MKDKYVKCEECGGESWYAAAKCVRCGADLVEQRSALEMIGMAQLFGGGPKPLPVKSEPENTPPDKAGKNSAAPEEV